MKSENDEHEKKVERFYSTGQAIANLSEDEDQKENFEFLSFGYWHNYTRTYHEAARNLIEYVISRSEIRKSERILNVTCGYGAETFLYYKMIKPDIIEGIDITKKHVDYANSRAKQLKLDEKVRFHHGDAVKLTFPDNVFSHIIGIEGPVHFSCRNEFFKSAFRVLKSGGELILTDIIGKNEKSKKKKYLIYLTHLIATLWHVPKHNLISSSAYREQLLDANLEIIDFKRIGQNVFPGYSMNGLTLKTIKTRIIQRGFLGAIGVNMISLILGYLYNNGMIDYIFVRAAKTEQ
jgi:ubiquinone/menaquinone biosynthesis C-methylase UbiE